MNQILYSGKKNHTPTVLIASIAGIAVLIVFLVGFAVINMFNHKILSGVFAADIDVSNMTKEEAVAAISKMYQSSIIKDLVLTYKGEEYEVSTEEIGLTYTDVNKLAEEAYQYGRDNNIFVNNFNVLKSYFNGEKRIEAEKVINRSKLENAVNRVVGEDNEFLKGDYYEVSGDKLLLTKGTEGKKIDFDALEKAILLAVEENEAYIELPIVDSEPDSLDIDAVYAKVHQEPVDVSYTEGENFEIVSEQNGIDFDVAEAKAKYAELAKGETAEIALTVLEPKVKMADLGDELFKTVIATYSSQYSASDNNLAYATSKCNGVVVNPGEEFSFQTTLGNQEATRGYDQMASTLYNAVLRADLEVVARTAHNTWVAYVPQSTDAMVNASNDFKFKNDRKYPIKIVTSCNNGVCTASIYGIKNANELTVEVETKILETVNYTTQKQNDATLAKGKTKVAQSPLNGYVSEAYKVYYQEGKETSRKLVSKDTYTAIEEIIKVGTKVVKKTNTTTKPQTTTPAPQVVPTVDPNFILPPGWDNPESGY